MGGSTTAIADSRSGTVILTGDADSIRAIVDRLQALEGELGDARPKPIKPTP
jgi:hypothetical protein